MSETDPDAQEAASSTTNMRAFSTSATHSALRKRGSGGALEQPDREQQLADIAGFLLVAALETLEPLQGQAER